MANESDSALNDAGDDFLSQISDDDLGKSEDSNQEGEEEIDETNVEIGVDVIYDEDSDGGDVNESSHADKYSNHQISLNNYATSNPILLVFLVLLTAAISFGRQL